MKKLKSIAVFLIASIVTVCSSGVNVPLEVRAYEAPTDIHVIVETKEIDIEDIPENRCVPLNIYTENCPPYIGLRLVFEKDSRLSFREYPPFSPAVDVPNMGGLSSSYHTTAAPDFMACSIPSSGDTIIDYNGLLIQANLILPENVSEGDFYKFEPLKKFDKGYISSSAIFLANDFDAVFEETPFSQLTGGGIRITRKAPPETDPPHTEPPVVIPENTPAPEVNNNVPPQEAPPENNNAQPEGNNQNASQETQTEAVTEGVTTITEAKETTVTQTEISTTTVTVTEKTTTTTEETKVSTSDTTTSEVVTTAEVIEETKEKSSNILHIIIPVSIAAVLSAVFIVIKKVKGKAQ